MLCALLIGATAGLLSTAKACDDGYYYDDYAGSECDYETGCWIDYYDTYYYSYYSSSSEYIDTWDDWDCSEDCTGGECEGESCSCEGGNPFTVYDGNARRGIKELELPGTFGRHFSWARHHNTVPRLGRASLGQAGSWRHSWQYELTLLPTRNGHRASCDFISPAGMRRSFELAADGVWLPATRFHERLEAVADGFDLITGGGVRLHFVAVAGDGPEGRRYEMRALTDPHGLVTRLDYDELGNVTKVTDPAGRFFELAYRELPQQKRFERTLAWLDSAAPGADGWVEVAVPAWFAQHQSFRYLRCVSAEGAAIGVAEAHYFAPGDTQPLTGASLAGGVALDLGASRNIARVRVRPLAGASLAGVTVSGLDVRPASARVLAGVRASDGRSVNYDYETAKDTAFGFEYPALTQARYGDGATAHYRYQQTAPASQPLLVEADDPRYDGRAKRIQYAYRADHARGLGFIHQEINPVTGGVYASLELDPANPDKRIVHYSDLRSVAYLTPEATNGQPTERTDALGCKTHFEYDEDGRLQAKVDHAGRRTELTYDEHGRVQAERREGRLEKHTSRDALGRKIATTDRYGRTRTYGRDAFGRVIRSTPADSVVREFTRDAFGRVTSFKQGDGGAHAFAYDERGLKISRTDPRGNATRYGYDAQDRRVSITDALGRITRREVNDRGLTTKIIHPDGTTESFAYDAYGRKTATTDLQGRTTKLAYDELGRVTRQEDPVGRVTTFDYTELPQGCGSCTLAPNATRIVGPDGTVTTRLYDTESRLLAHTVASNTAQAATTLYVYDNDNNLVSVTDPLGAVTRYTYDDEHHRLTATDPLARVTRWTYDDHGNVISVTDPDGGVTRSEYDASDRVIKTTDAAGNVIHREYDSLGNLVVLTEPVGKKTRYTYDGKRRTAAQFPDGKRQTWEYDAAGRPVREISPDGVVTTRTYDTGNRILTVSQSSPSLPSLASSVFAHDALGRRVSTTDPLGRTTRWTYDAAGNVLAEIRPDGAQTSYVYDGRNRRTATTDAAGNITRFDYDAADNLTALTDARANTYRFTYDARHRKTAMIYPDGSQETWVYELTGRLAGYANRAGQTKTVSYNAGGQPVIETWTDSDVGGALRPDIPRPTTYQYDTIGRLTLLDNGQAKLGYTYDALGRVASESSDLSALVSGLAAHTVRYGFDPLGRKSELAYPDGSKVSYDYDARGRLDSVNDGPGRAVGRYDYDPLGRIAKLSRDNNVATSYVYDMAGQLSDIAHTKGNTVLAGIHYSLDQLGRRAAQTREDGITENYAYDATGQLTGADYGTGRTEGFAYDPAGNRMVATEITNPQSQIQETTYTTNNLNQYTRIASSLPPSSSHLQYDANGNLIDDGRQRYRYDAQNRLISVESVSVGGALRPDSVRAEFFYDARNRCILRKYYTLGSQAQWILNTADSRALTYDTRWNLLSERTLNGAQAGKYIHGQRTDEILASNLGSQILYPLADGLGSTVALSDQQGRVTERYRYSAYGQPTALNAEYSLLATGSAPLQYRFLFTGREWLDSIRLNDHRNRYYSPESGRWLNTDPIRFEGGMNLVSYCANNPAANIDSHGLASCPCGYWCCVGKVGVAEAAAASCFASFPLGVAACIEVCAISPKLCVFCIVALPGAQYATCEWAYDKYLDAEASGCFPW